MVKHQKKPDSRLTEKIRRTPEWASSLKVLEVIRWLAESVVAVGDVHPEIWIQLVDLDRLANQLADQRG